MKKLASVLLALSMILMLAACGSNTPASSVSTPAAGLRIAIVTSSGIDDGNFTQNCYEGILEFISTHPDATVTEVKEPDISKTMEAAVSVIADYDVLVLPGFQYATIGAYAADNPNTKIILVDAFPTDADFNEFAEPLDNVYAMQFKEQESGFLAGVAAAMQTETGKVAVVNGIAYPSNVNYQYGFMAGVNYANANYGTSADYVELASYAGEDVTGANVGGNYVGDFNMPDIGKVLGEALIAENVDIMLVAAGGSGGGVFTAAKEAENVFVIGCDVDEYDSGAVADRNVVLTSALKVMSINVTRQLNAIANGTFVGANETLGADSDSTGIVLADGRHQLDAETVEKLKEVFALIKDGTIVPPANFNGYLPTDFPGLEA